MVDFHEAGWSSCAAAWNVHVTKRTLQWSDVETWGYVRASIYVVKLCRRLTKPRGDCRIVHQVLHISMVSEPAFWTQVFKSTLGHCAQCLNDWHQLNLGSHKEWTDDE